MIPPADPSLVPVLAQLKVIALDVDGVLTDGTFWWGSGGEEFKRFTFRDIMGLSMARKAGIILALVSGEDNPQLTRLASKMSIADVFPGCREKGKVVDEIIAKHRLAAGEICFMGDDVNDLSAMQAAGLGIAPADAHPAAIAAARIVTTRKGGEGAVRELIDAVLAAKNQMRS